MDSTVNMDVDKTFVRDLDYWNTTVSGYEVGVILCLDHLLMYPILSGFLWIEHPHSERKVEVQALIHQIVEIGKLFWG